ncbi:hypothetical protein H4Q26_015248 [Puccinia striiformis f. sp. tritici PST-130]|uniref:Peptidase M24 domain-containing protein n=1 Tax=Puccinia striiformis f. sp. tritici PST-78 TaxID=1165861 RepID=A0A0L0V896_9BASI|nr:hypothetical protein H4Q26_015248 [Puccinia striiformis f. sp. tritici PST-130]KNE95500.1 hypothetical protein PSTG_11214 [Puccinia striiformis f. sp. tritici PST-78]
MVSQTLDHSRKEILSTWTLPSSMKDHERFHDDLNATYPVGKISEESEHLIKSTRFRRGLDRVISICRPSALFREIGNIIEPMAKQAGLNVNKGYCGHGISQRFHGPPNTPHYAKSKAIGEMKPGMVCD